LRPQCPVEDPGYGRGSSAPGAQGVVRRPNQETDTELVGAGVSDALTGLFKDPSIGQLLSSRSKRSQKNRAQ